QASGIKLFAAAGKVEIQAQSNDIDIIADKVLKLISAKDSIHIIAEKEVFLTAQESYLKINDSGVEHGTLAGFTVYSASKNFTGPKSLAEHFNNLPKTKFDQELFIKHFSGKSAKNLDFVMNRDTGKIKGQTAGNGTSKIQKSDFPEVVQVILKKTKT
ncbi:DUF2345 domain-containing protein, partial [Hydromonas duriensis]|uniref:DUF2345 domain-containing protein n=1 Tax=Hydromonas duriensis TaxID=1527608 RepID=UPI0013C355B9